MVTTIIGVDVGNGLTKTVNSDFISSVKDYGDTKPAIMDRTVMYNGRYYTVGGRRSKTKTDQKEDITAFILALAGIGEELKSRSYTEQNEVIDVVLSEGLPLERCIEENRIEDERYYKKGETFYFEYENVPYNIHIADVIVSPQCLSGAVDLINDNTLPPICLLIDVGSWTVDILPVIEGKPVGSESRSLLNGVINCMLECNEEVRRRTGKEILEEQIQQIMRGKTGVLPPKYEQIVSNKIREYVKNLADTLTENSYNVDTTPCIFMGGGATVVRNFGKELFPLAKYILDIRANAVGYEKIAMARMGVN
jgi:plasmid segregation protein ParM